MKTFVAKRNGRLGTLSTFKGKHRRRPRAGDCVDLNGFSVKVDYSIGRPGVYVACNGMGDGHLIAMRGRSVMIAGIVPAPNGLRVVAGARKGLTRNSPARATPTRELGD